MEPSNSNGTVPAFGDASASGQKSDHKIDVVVDSYAWLPKASLSPSQIARLKRDLTIYPKQFAVAEGEEIKPILLYRERPDHLGIAREYFLRHKRAVHRIIPRYTRGDLSNWVSPGEFVGTLRPEQEPIVDTVVTKFESGTLGGIICARPGSGKTVCSCAVIARMQIPTLVIVHKEFLMNQWRERLAQFLPEAAIGVVQQDVCDYRGKSVVVGMVHSLIGGKYGEHFYEDAFGLVIVDECFIGSQRVLTASGYERIDCVKVGQLVQTAVGLRAVARVTQRWTSLENLRTVRVAGYEVVCTKDHPFLTLRGWVAAGDLSHRDTIVTLAGSLEVMEYVKANMSSVSEAELGTKGQEVLFSQVHRGSQSQASSFVRMVQDKEVSESNISFLWNVLSAEMDEVGTSDSGVEGEVVGNGSSVACGKSERGQGSVDAYAPKESNAYSGDAAEGFSKVKGVATPTFSTRREWRWVDRASAFADGEAGVFVGGGARSADTEAEAMAQSLQARHCKSRENGSCRSGWDVSQSVGEARSGSSERRFPLFLGVESVEISEQRSVERLGGRCEAGRVRVHNLTVEGHPSYVLEGGAVVHNCHRISSYTWSKAPGMFRAKHMLGVSATPRRKDRTEAVFFGHIGEILYISTEQRLTPEIRCYQTDFRLYARAGAHAHRALLLKFLCGSVSRNRTIIGKLVSATRAGRKVLVLSERIQHLKNMEALLKETWPADEDPPTTDYYIGGRPRVALDTAARAQVIFATSQFVSEGLDIPALDTLFLTTPLSDVEQAVGRILRPCEGKKPPIVVDFRDDKVPQLQAQAQQRDRYYSTIV